MTYLSLLRGVVLLLCGGLCVGLRADEIVKGKAVPNHIRPQVIVLPARWADKIPPTGRVNAPMFLSSVYPGQRITVGLLAEGPDRARLFDGVAADIRISPARRGGEWHAVKPRSIRAIKAEGADFSLMALRAAAISPTELAKIEEMCSLVTLAVFDVELEVPEDAGEELEISLTISGPTPTVTTEPNRLQVRTTAQWLNTVAPTPDQIGRQLNHDCSDIPPGQFLSWGATLASDRHFDAPPVQTIFAMAFRSNPALRAAAVEIWPRQEPVVQDALLRSLRLADIDVGALLPSLPAEKVSALRATAPLDDVRVLPQFVDGTDVKRNVARLGSAMDQCWGAWIATGDKDYLKPIVDYLAYADDFPAVVKWQQTRGGTSGLTPAVARGLGYQIAGWSLSSFMRTDPHVMDWLLYWQHDPAISPKIQQQLASLMTNPAFRRH